MGDARNQKSFRVSKTTPRKKWKWQERIRNQPPSSDSTSSWKTAMQTPYYEMNKHSYPGSNTITESGIEWNKQDKD